MIKKILLILFNNCFSEGHVKDYNKDPDVGFYLGKFC